MDFLDFIRKVHEERKARNFVIKGGPGSGWYAPPKGTHGVSRGKLRNAAQIAKKDLETALNGSIDEAKAVLGRLGWGGKTLDSLQERQIRMAAAKRMPASAEEWLSHQKGETITMYHGTARPLKDLEKEGIKAKPSTFASVGQEAGVFLVAEQNKRWAEYWANKSKETHGGRGEIVVLKIEVPRKDIKIDPANPKSFMYTAKDIPPDSIIEATKLKANPTKDFKFHVVVDDPRGGTSNVQINDVFEGR